MGLLANKITATHQANNGSQKPSPAAIKYFEILRKSIGNVPKAAPKVEAGKPKLDLDKHFSFNPGKDFENIDWK